MVNRVDGSDSENLDFSSEVNCSLLNKAYEALLNELTEVN